MTADTKPAVNTVWIDDHDEPLHEFFGRDSESYNIHLEEDGYDDQDGSGRPGIGIVANALQFWVGQQSGAVRVRDAAAAFVMPVEAVAQAVRYGSWMLLAGNSSDVAEQRIELEGE
jgi:hypothetical protein